MKVRNAMIMICTLVWFAGSLLSANGHTLAAAPPVISINGKILKSAVPPITGSGIVYAELRSLLTGLGFSVSVQGNNVTARTSALDWRFNAVSKIGKINGQYEEFKSGILKSGSRIYLSLNLTADVLGADLAVSGQRRELTTAKPEERLIRAIMNHDLAKVTAIVRAGQKLDSAAFTVKPMEAAVSANDRDIVGYLLKRQGASKLNETYASGDTPLLIAIQNRSKEMIAYLASSGADGNLYNPRRAYPLFAAIETGDEGVVWALLQLHVNQNIVDGQGRTPIVSALQSDKPGIALLLAQAGANLYVRVSPDTRDVFEYLNRNPAYAAYVPAFQAAANLTMSRDQANKYDRMIPFLPGMEIIVKDYVVLDGQWVARISVVNKTTDKLTVQLSSHANKIYRKYEREPALFVPLEKVPAETCKPTDDRTLAECNAKMQVYRDKLAAAEAERNRQLAEAKSQQNSPGATPFKTNTITTTAAVSLNADGTAELSPLTNDRTEEYWIFLPLDGQPEQRMAMSIAVNGQIRANVTIQYDVRSKTPESQIPAGMLKPPGSV